MRSALFALCVLAPNLALAEAVTVFAAASLKGPLDVVAGQFQASTGHEVTISYGGSSALAQQIIQGAPVDVFVSAAPAWMDAVETEGLVQSDSRKDLFGNSLVLFAHDPEARPVTLGTQTDLKGLLAGGKLAMALVDAVPAGQYGKAALTALGLWDSVAADVVQAKDVRAALRLVTSGEAPLGVVYATDAVGQEGAVVATFPASSHPPITYPAALVSAKPAAAEFLTYLQGPEGDAAFAAAGFVLLP